MENQSQDKLLRLYVRLNALKSNLSKNSSITDNFVREYHLIIDELANLTSLDLNEFKVPMSEVRPYPLGEGKYTQEIFCNGAVFFSKLDALISYFQIKYLSKDDVKIGFSVKE
ncbi:MAG: hypothetical protein NTZ97_04805 [Candidatus Moranbacteria bacterium]|nr:hypothetical protein [Candidatus Moranbacteria bacterium]